MNAPYRFEPLTKPCEVPRLPDGKTSIYQLTKRECREWYRKVVKQLYPEIWGDLMREYLEAIANEPEGEPGIQLQLSSLLSYWVWWY